MVGKHKCTKENVEFAIKAKKAGSTNKDICRMLCVSEQTFYRWLRDPKTDNQRSLCEQLKKVEAEYKRNLLSLIYNKAIDKDNPTWQAAAWLLERKYPDEYAQRQRVKTEQEVNTHIDVSQEDNDQLYGELKDAAGRMAAVYIAQQS